MKVELSMDSRNKTNITQTQEIELLQDETTELQRAT